MSENFDGLKDKYYQQLATEFQIYEMECDLQQLVVTKPAEPMVAMDVDIDIQMGDPLPTDSDLVI